MEEESKPKRFRRTKASIEEGINKAAKELILKKGFADVTVLDIIKKARIEPITFYNRYKNQEEFYDIVDCRNLLSQSAPPLFALL